MTPRSPRESNLEGQTHACPSLTAKERQENTNRATDRANYKYSETLGHQTQRSMHLKATNQRLTYHLPPNWQLRTEEFRRGWLYTNTKPSSTSGSWSHEGTGAWFLNLDGNCYPWRQELDPTTGYTFLWLHGGAAIMQYRPVFGIHDQA